MKDENDSVQVLLRQLVLASRPVRYVSITHSLYNYGELYRHGSKANVYETKELPLPLQLTTQYCN